jgi:hypothetical protein
MHNGTPRAETQGKRLVDFNRVKVLGIVSKECFGGKRFRIKRAFPVFILPPLSPDVDISLACHERFP